jgi:hypothetical protein
MSATAILPGDIPTSYLPSSIAPSTMVAISPNPNGLNIYATPRAELTAPSSNMPQLSQPSERRMVRAASGLTVAPQVQRANVDDDNFNSLPTVESLPPSIASSRRSSIPSDSPSSGLFATPAAAISEGQAIGVRKYFQQRWKADPNFNEALQYKLLVGKTGKVISIEGQTETSRTYLDRVGFLRPGNQVASDNYVREQFVLLILRSDGEVETLVDSE